jgi:hypothetical protein
MPRKKHISIEQCLEILEKGKHAVRFYNNCYGGGPSPSDALMELLRTKYKDCEDYDIACLKGLRDLGNTKGSQKYSLYGAILVRKEFEPFITFHEYDGAESLSFRVSITSFKESIIPKFFEDHEVITKDQYHALLASVDSQTDVVYIEIPE